jgi:hypothetical protein
MCGLKWLTCGEPVHSKVSEGNVRLVEDERPALVVHVPVHQHEVQQAVRQLPKHRATWRMNQKGLRKINASIFLTVVTGRQGRREYRYRNYFLESIH